MAGVKTERTTAGHITPPKRSKDWVPEPRVIRPKGNPAVRSLTTGTVPRRLAESADEKKAVSDYDATSKLVAGCRPGDGSSEGKYAVAHRRLVRLGLTNPIRRKYRP